MLTTSKSHSVDIEPRGITPVVADIDLNSISHCALPSLPAIPLKGASQTVNAMATALSASLQNADSAVTGGDVSKDKKSAKDVMENTEGILSKPVASEQKNLPENDKYNAKPHSSGLLYPSTWREALVRKHTMLRPKLPKNYERFSLFTGKYHLRTDEITFAVRNSHKIPRIETFIVASRSLIFDTLSMGEYVLRNSGWEH